LLQQLGMAAGGNSALFQDNDPIGPEHGRQAMRNDNRGTGSPNSKGPPSSLVQLRTADNSRGARDTRPEADVPRVFAVRRSGSHSLRDFSSVPYLSLSSLTDSRAPVVA
jgi:hypothetical protein